MVRQTEIEAAKSNQSKCNTCKKNIEKGELRAKVVDDREFKEYVRNNPDCKEGEGYFRGYFETQNGCISIHKYFVHLKCYQPITPHPKEAKYFKLMKMKAPEKEAFKKWIDGQDLVPPPQPQANGAKGTKKGSKKK